LRALGRDGARLALDAPTRWPSGPRCGHFPPALAARAVRRVSVAPLIDAVYPLDDAVAAFARAATPGTLKVLVDAKA